MKILHAILTGTLGNNKKNQNSREKSQLGKYLSYGTKNLQKWLMDKEEIIAVK